MAGKSPSEAGGAVESGSPERSEIIIIGIKSPSEAAAAVARGGTRESSWSKTLLEIIIVTIPAVLTYFAGWVYLHFYLRNFGIDVSELDLDLPTILIYSYSPLKALIYSFLPALGGVAIVIAIILWLSPRFRLLMQGLYRSVLLQLLLLIAVMVALAFVSVPIIQSVATQAAKRKWDNGVGLRIDAIIKEPEPKWWVEKGKAHDYYRDCGSRGVLDLIFSDKHSYYVLCVAESDRTAGLVFEVRREAGLVSVRFLEAH